MNVLYDFEDGRFVGNFLFEDVVAKIVMVKGEKGDMGASGDYAGLINKPSIGNVTLSGNKTAYDLGLATPSDILSAISTKADQSDLDALRRYTIEAEPINVLSLGVKNDGTEDISVIVNQYTKTNALYFPAGIYRIDEPLNIVNSIYGVGYNRRYYVDPTFTTFVSHIETVDNSSSVINVIGQGSGSEIHTCINICNVFIKLNSNENGIKVTTSDVEDIFIKEISICDIGDAYGVWAAHTVETSRALFIDSCTLYGSLGYKTSVGIVIDEKAWDCRVTNTEIMGVQKGIWQKGSIVYMSDMHIWCGCRSNADNDDWWEKTICIDCSNDIYGSVILTGNNIYLDSAYHYIETWRGNALTFNNLIAWMDGSMQGSSAYDGYFVYTRGDIVEKAVLINGLIGYFSDRCKYIFSESVDIINARILYDNGDNFISGTDIRHFPTTRWCNIDRFKFVDYSDTDTYFEVARCHLPTGSRIEFTVSSLSDFVTFYCENDNNTVKITCNHKKGGSFYYRYSNDVLYIYRYRVTAGSGYYQIVVNNASDDASLLIYPYIRVFQRDVQASSDGLTKIDIKMDASYSFDNLSATQIQSLSSYLNELVPVLVSMDASATALLTENRETKLAKGYATKLTPTVIDYNLTIGLDNYIIRTNANANPTSIIKVNTTSIK